jgi:hypothetical protein
MILERKAKIYVPNKINHTNGCLIENIEFRLDRKNTLEKLALTSLTSLKIFSDFIHTEQVYF